ncbi:hypothetical protein [Ramlibacter rhizophilus]|uniref:Uncharacterized protein n=1 Tax=Ramlibacter rhizophilus TaxID=1781167 RepID=A0A4Z0BY21_9BURK|nr:hypothetical protein [Ramlibacter rhizophilus]TFZ04226.1 hypothetical protein EZ242_00220 [Ramlibacter rhizophilus]
MTDRKITALPFTSPLGSAPPPADSTPGPTPLDARQWMAPRLKTFDNAIEGLAQQTRELPCAPEKARNLVLQTQALRSALWQIETECIRHGLEPVGRSRTFSTIAAAKRAITQLGLPDWGAEGQAAYFESVARRATGSPTHARAEGTLLGLRFGRCHASQLGAFLEACARHLLDAHAMPASELAPFLSGFLAETVGGPRALAASPHLDTLVAAAFRHSPDKPAPEDVEGVVVRAVRLAVHTVLPCLGLRLMTAAAFRRYLQALLTPPDAQARDARHWLSTADFGLVLAEVWLTLAQAPQPRLDLLGVLLDALGEFPVPKEERVLELLETMQSRLGDSCRNLDIPRVRPPTLLNDPLWAPAYARVNAWCAQHQGLVQRCVGNGLAGTELAAAIRPALVHLDRLSAYISLRTTMPDPAKAALTRRLDATRARLREDLAQARFAAEGMALLS